MTHPAAEIHIDLPLVRGLLEGERPDLADQPLRLVDEGWDNVTVRIGKAHAARLPRRRVAVDLLLNERRWLPVLAPRLPVSVPVPVQVGTPGPFYPWPWSVVEWIPGETAEAHAFTLADAELLARTLRSLHQPAPDDAPVNPMRGVPLRTREDVLEERLHRLTGAPGIDVARLRAALGVALAAPAADARCWIHGDLHPRNVVTRGGSLCGLIDWGDLNGGDVATDVACAWTLMDDLAARRRFLETYGAASPVEHRARGWAIYMGLALVDSGEPRHVPLGLATLGRVLTDAGAS